jgi:hypothetical protein
MPDARSVHRGTTRLLSTVMVLLGVAMVISTLARGGGPLSVGVIFGVLFVAAGAARLYLASRTGGA